MELLENALRTTSSSNLSDSSTLSDSSNLSTPANHGAERAALVEHAPTDARGHAIWTAPDGGVPIKAWVRGVPVEADAKAQLAAVAKLPFVHRHVAVMPDVHLGVGATIGSVIPTKGALVPAAVGVDLGCGMSAVKTSLVASQLPDSLVVIRAAIEAAVPHGRTNDGGAGDRGAWRDVPDAVATTWKGLDARWQQLVADHPRLARGPTAEHLGTLGTGNHFVELCLDESDAVWVMLHSGSRGLGNRIGRHFIEAAKKACAQWMIPLPHADLAYLPEGVPLFGEYVGAVRFAQDYAAANRALMMQAVLRALAAHLPSFDATLEAVSCHHNYVAREHHFGENVWVTRKGAVRAKKGELGIIPGSMGARSFIVRGRGEPESFDSCSHGAGRAMSRAEARRRFSLDDHAKATSNVECRKDADVIDETPAAYKSIDAVMDAQRDLVDVVHVLRQVVCVKG
ncbi:RtcB family protein [Myxococcota bacterium]|nr:RtcB family protein [Myxococcota bacterium]